jgi:UDP-2,4-diacetamido-2,4,6-trideoxy-beta-L-altropyranose hydrolase
MKIAPLCAAPGLDEDAQEVRQLAAALDADWIVIDGYRFDAPYQLAVNRIGRPVLVIDDYASAAHYTADIVFNQNLNASADMYHGKSSASHLLLGTRYALLRREFWPWRNWKRTFPAGRSRVLVTLGGSDPDNITSRVVLALRSLSDLAPRPDIELMVVVGSSNLHLSAVQAAIYNSSVLTTLHVDVQNMPELMAQADVAIYAGGGTCWELAFMGLPGLTLVLAENQAGAAAALADAGIGVNLGWSDGPFEERLAHALIALLSDRQGLEEMSARGRLLVDGNGAQRTVQALQERVR